MDYFKKKVKNLLITVNKKYFFDEVKEKIDKQLTKSLDDSVNKEYKNRDLGDQMYIKLLEILEKNKKDLKYKKNSNEQEEKTLTQNLQILKDNYLQKLNVLKTESNLEPNENNIKKILKNIKSFKIELIKNIYDEYNCFLVEIIFINQNKPTYALMEKKFKDRIEKKYNIIDLESECGIIEESAASAASSSSASSAASSASSASESSASAASTSTTVSRGGKTKNKKQENKKTRKIKKKNYLSIT